MCRDIIKCYDLWGVGCKACQRVFSSQSVCQQDCLRGVLSDDRVEAGSLTSILSTVIENLDLFFRPPPQFDPGWMGLSSIDAIEDIRYTNGPIDAWINCVRHVFGCKIAERSDVLHNVFNSETAVAKQFGTALQDVNDYSQSLCESARRARGEHNNNIGDGDARAAARFVTMEKMLAEERDLVATLRETISDITRDRVSAENKAQQMSIALQEANKRSVPTECHPPKRRVRQRLVGCGLPAVDFIPLPSMPCSPVATPVLPIVPVPVVSQSPVVDALCTAPIVVAVSDGSPSLTCISPGTQSFNTCQVGDSVPDCAAKVGETSSDVAMPKLMKPVRVLRQRDTGVKDSMTLDERYEFGASVEHFEGINDGDSDGVYDVQLILAVKVLCAEKEGVSSPEYQWLVKWEDYSCAYCMWLSQSLLGDSKGELAKDAFSLRDELDRTRAEYNNARVLSANLSCRRRDILRNEGVAI